MRLHVQALISAQKVCRCLKAHDKAVYALMQVVFVAQQPWAAPGRTLREQIVYPSTRGSAAPDQLCRLLRSVRLGHLLARVQGDCERPGDWQGEGFLCGLDYHSS